MAIEQSAANANHADVPTSQDSGSSTWAQNWDLWWRRVGAFTWALLIVFVWFKLEQSIRTSTLELKLELALPLIFGTSIGFSVWNGSRHGRIEKKLRNEILWSLLFMVWLTYFGIVNLTHFLR